MNIVLYADDLEPITVIDVPAELVLNKSFTHIRLPVPWDTNVWKFDPSEEISIRIVTIWREELVRKGRRNWMWFTSDEELALLLKSDLLPGQRKENIDSFRHGFISGFFEALKAAR